MTPQDAGPRWMQRLISRIHKAKVLPVVSNVIGNNLAFGSDQELTAKWAKDKAYPFSDRQSLTRMIQYQSVMAKADPEDPADDLYIKEDYLDFLKIEIQSVASPDLVRDLIKDSNLGGLTFSQIAARLARPSFDDGISNPLLVLAELPLPIYLTTSYHNFIEVALRKADRTPRTEICRWTHSLESIPSVFDTDANYVPSREEPLVFHLFGLDAHPSSLVLTEDDHLDFLVAVSENQRAIPPRVRQALADSSLVLLGYGLQQWDFRVLFRGLVKTSITKRSPKSVFIQLAKGEQEGNYLKSYLAVEAQCEVYWGSVQAFMLELWQGWGS